MCSVFFGGKPVWQRLGSQTSSLPSLASPGPVSDARWRPRRNVWGWEGENKRNSHIFPRPPSVENLQFSYYFQASGLKTAACASPSGGPRQLAPRSLHSFSTSGGPTPTGMTPPRARDFAAPVCGGGFATRAQEASRRPHTLQVGPGPHNKIKGIACSRVFSRISSSPSFEWNSCIFVYLPCFVCPSFHPDQSWW